MKILVRLPLLAPILGLLIGAAAHCAHAQAPIENSISLGILMDLTGPAAPLGEDCRQGFELARNSFAKGDKIKGIAVRFVLGDSKGEQRTAVTEFSRMVDLEKVVAVLVSRTGLATAVNPVSRQKKVSILASSANPAFVDENKYAFRIWVRADQEGDKLASKAAEKEVKTIAVITTEEDYLMVLSKSFKASFEKQGGKIVFDETIDREFVDFSSLLPRLRERNPDAIFVNVTIPQLGIAYKRLHELRIKTQFFSNYWVFKKDVLEAAGAQAVEGVIAVEMDYRKPNFENAFKTEFGHPPLSVMAYSCYVSTAQLIQAISQNQDIRTAEDMYKELLKIETVPLLDDPGIIKNRELQSPLIYEQYREGRVEVMPR